MGYYINPPGQTKEQWLKAHGRLITETEARSLRAMDEYLIVCLVDNGWMTAAGICYDDHERDMFMLPDTDGPQRPRKWYVATRTQLSPYLPEHLRKAA